GAALLDRPSAPQFFCPEFSRLRFLRTESFARSWCPSPSSDCEPRPYHPQQSDPVSEHECQGTFGKLRLRTVWLRLVRAECLEECQPHDPQSLAQNSHPQSQGSACSRTLQNDCE